ncbi:quinone oxidoreductase [Didymosphaeria variabile]|uniref:Quinone oxidoreductase n=1 Tax=Didymosphaeria variabile TaxID=1932322 RepID=A0A9W8XNL8_9PLEO|nr:quinone oxidoreductase [Didymosphaeria variabile]KAJ4355729.1 quinone oxidoreductase [Didymosphaeria variabile]
MAPLPKQTRQWIVSNPPKTSVSLSGDDATFKLQTVDTPSVNDGQVLVKLKYLSNDPAQRGWIQSGVDAERLYVPPVRQGDVMRSYGIGEIVQSKAENLKEGQLVSYTANWSDYRVLEAKEVTPVQEDKEAGIKATHYIGALGGPGLTAYYGLVGVAEATKDDTVVVSGAAGSTGSMVVQIAKHVLGCKRVIGIAGGDKKCKWVESLGADACIDYKASDFEDKLWKATEGYVEVYFDNVGGHILDLMLKRIKRYGRVAACGSIATYNDPESTRLKNWFEVIANRIQIRGFIVFDAYTKGNGQEMMNAIRNAVKERKIQIEKQEETIVPTKFEEIPKTWTMLFEGGNQGKLVTELKE